MADGTGFRVGSRVYWHGIFPNRAKMGTVTEKGKADDLRQLVLWDGYSEPTWTWTSALMKVSARCTCGYCKRD